DAVPFFLEELANPATRIDAAIALHERGRPEGVAAMIETWKRSPADSENIGWMPAILAHTRELDALRALAADLKLRPIAIRHAVVDAVGDLGTHAGEKPLSAGQCRIVEDILAMCLSDGCRYDQLRNCDTAAVALAVQFGTPRSFNADAPYCVRDRQLTEITNEWRRRRGLPPLPALPARRPSSLPAERSFQAVSVRLSPGSADPGPELRARLHDLEGKQLAGDAVVNLWCHVVRIAAPMTRVQLILERPGDGGGAELQLGLYPEVGMTASQNEWRYNQRVVVGAKALALDRITDHSAADGRSAEDWDAMRKAVTDAFAAQPDKYILIEVDSATNR
ncbi:MAG: hypothetical protein ACJ8F7_06515, partial [Gemmataceae bacterium]